MNKENFYLSPICTNCLGDALISISNMYARLKKFRSKKISIYYHHWPKYFELLWPHLAHPDLDIDWQKLQNWGDSVINADTEALWKDRLLKTIKRSDFTWHPSRAYSMGICRIHPVIVEDLRKLKITEDRVLLNCTDLDAGVEYISFKKAFEKHDSITFQSVSVRENGEVAHSLDLRPEIAKFKATNLLDVSKFTDLGQLIEAIGQAKLHLGIDSGPAHIALAMRTPLIMFYNNLRGHRGLESIYHLYKNYHGDFLVKKLNDPGNYKRIAS
jgi:hypothetical protein